ncbi:MAG: T9SS type A sorting domain-containing protein [Bacteroidota bacterium]
MRLIVASLLILSHTILFSQSYQLSNKIPVKDMTGGVMAHPWSGGMNNPQFSTVDLDLDGNKEMVVFDKSEYTFTVFKNGGSPNKIDYEYAPEMLAQLDSCECVQWALFADYNCDGLEDLFCGRGSGSNFRIYEQLVYPTESGDSVGFELRYDPIFTDGSSWMYVVRTDIPAIIDIDWDGDVDVVSSTNGYNFFVLNRNLSMELYGRCDTLHFVSEFGCWGEFAESSVDNTLAVGDSTSCPRGGGGEPGGSSRHVGSSLLVFDMNADSLHDVLVGDVSYPTMVGAYNHGSKQYALMDSVETLYPQLDVSIDVRTFPAAFYEDVNNDGVRDLLVAPNTTIEALENVSGVVVYENDGEDNQVDFRYTGRDFLVQDHIDAGEYSSPYFFDHNNDGLLDLLVAGAFTNILVGDSLYEYNRSYLYENVGSAEAAVFQIADSSYLDYDLFDPPIRQPALGGGDLDGDGDMDLLLGISEGLIYHFINTAAEGMPADYSLATQNLLTDSLGIPIDIGGAAAPELYDYDADGDLDLFIGNRLGRIWHYENVGDSLNFVFSLVTETFGKIKVSNDYGSFYSGFAHPRFLDYDHDQAVELIIGSETGKLEIFDDLHLAETDSLETVGYLFDFGTLSNMTAAILDTSGLYTYVAGNPRGGLMLYAWTVPDTTPDDTIMGLPPIVGEDIRIYPNPAESELWIEMNPGMSGYDIMLHNMVGQMIRKDHSREQRFRMDLSGLSSGLYLVELRKDNHRHLEKIWIR